jgi:hypothetical protein
VLEWQPLDAVARRVEVNNREASTNNRSISAAARRMRRHRQRRLDRMRSLTIELREIEIDALIRSGFLEERSRDDSSAVI